MTLKLAIFFKYKEIPIFQGQSYNMSLQSSPDYSYNHYIIANPIRIISYADRHWTSNFKINLYDKLGFKKVSEGYPNYWYLIRDHREYRFNWRKSSLKKKLSNFDPTLSEYQNMLNNGYDRIWGCGSLKYEYVCAHN